MQVGALGVTAGQNPLLELLRRQKEQAEDLLGRQDLSAAQVATEQTSLRQVVSTSNLMSGSFVHVGEANANRSRYLEGGALSLAEARRSVAQVMDKAVVAFLGEMGVMNPGEQTDTEAGASMAVRRKGNRENSEAAERNLKEIRDNLEEKTEEATAPTDAEGNPITVGPDGASGSGSAAEPVEIQTGSANAEIPAASAGAAAYAAQAAYLPQASGGGGGRMSLDIVV